ncbi:MAG: molecular chaperone TorD family protein [Chloroflexi bacterium]|nr:molecular chaperone TorD family protein [Chloroflexota bacterium]
MAVKTPTDELVQRAAWYTVFSMLFRFPDEEIVQHVKTLVAELPVEVLDAEFRPRVAPFKQAAANAVPGDFVTEHSRLFTGAGLCRANENDYEKLSFSMTEKLADVAGFYHAFGFEVTAGVGERPDFIGTELDFVNLLLLKQAYALELGWPEKAEISARALNSFLESHFVKWVPKLCIALGELATTGGIYAAAADALAALVASENRRLGKSAV